MRVPVRLEAAARPFLRERVSRAYLCLVGAASALLVVDTLFVSHQDVSFSGIWLVLVTLPWTPLIWAVSNTLGAPGSQTAGYGWGAYAFGVGTALLSALANTLLLGAASRALRRHLRSR